MATQTSLTGKRWVARGGLPLASLRHTHGTKIAAEIARERGIEEDGEVVRIPAPPDLARAVKRAHKAANDGEQVGVFGDYDCDGITAAAQMVRYFRRSGREPLVRLPHRAHDGYGLTTSIAEEWIARGITVLITVDTGVTAVAPIALLKEKGIDVIVVDHHHLPEELPPAYAILHPGLTPRFAHPHPSGSGMAFLFLRGLEGEVWEDMHTDRALAMMGTVADLVELRGINRQLVTSGLRSLRELRSGPLAELRDEVASGMLTSTDVAFRIAPRLNAAGRMDDPMLALHALLEGGGHMTRLHALNRERQEVTARLVEKARRDTAHVLTVLKASASKEYPHGIIGLMAGSLTESTGCPSMVGAVHGDRITASLRSPRNYHVTEGLSRIGHLLESFGGHSQAAGCSFPAVRWREVCESLERDILRMQSAGDFLPTIEVDALLSEEDVSLQLAQSLMRLEPFGQGNPEPRFLLRGVTVRETRRVGEDAKHLQMDISGVRAIGFGLGAAQERIAGPVDAVCRVGINAWQGKRSVQLVVEDIATRDEQREARK